ncbi:hypothetical protein H6501_05455 [Candidatus Woesearchaeota archaeon]|nr:hypothetical protein [Nanoarchaeota archaeon]MCB9371021.1 hypothetical protein [Candidatus Woesearchaeota archaeon]USN44132.1 MAG: hypothetical protein H6500_07130 [Candidatus Woesearchaeota archaeon]
MVKTHPFLESHTLLSEEQKDTLIERLQEWYKQELSFLKNKYFYVTAKDKVFLSTVSPEEFPQARVNNVGIYFGTFHDSKRFRLSIEGALLIKPKQNLILVEEKAAKSFLSGENLFEEEGQRFEVTSTCPFQVVVWNNTPIGLVSIKGKELLSYLSKGRKLDFNKVF